MSFQRTANMKPASMDGGDKYSSRQLLEFFAKAKDAYFQHGCEDEVFVMEQMIDHLKEGGRLDPDKAQRILGI